MTLRPGPVVQPAAKSSLHLSLGEDIGNVTLWSDTQLALETLLRLPMRRGITFRVSLDLSQGVIHTWPSYMTEESRFEVKLPGGVAGVRGAGGRGLVTARIRADGVVSVFRSPQYDLAGWGNTRW